MNNRIFENIKFPCEALVLDYQPFENEKPKNISYFVNNLENAVWLCSKYSKYRIMFGIIVEVENDN